MLELLEDELELLVEEELEFDELLVDVVLVLDEFEELLELSSGSASETSSEPPQATRIKEITIRIKWHFSLDKYLVIAINLL